MASLWQMLEGTLMRNGMFTPENVAVSLLVAFVLGQLLAWVYMGTHAGVSYSRGFVQALVLMSVAVSLVMAVIGNSLITAFGLMGALALVRFRNVIKDTRDVVFVFCALVIGMAAGTQRHAIAIVGTVTLCAVIWYLHATSFGSRRSYGAFLRFTATKPFGPQHPAMTVLKRFCTRYALVSLQDGPMTDTCDCAYQLTLLESNRSEELAAALEEVPGIDSVSLTGEEELLEV